mgnify:CR=1 FL=1
MQEILFGRDPADNTLKISANGVSQNKEPVPQSVSRQHCKITITDDGKAIITNLNPRNCTFVNGVAITSQAIGGGDRIELGGERYPLDISKLKLPTYVSISHLKRIWDNYQLQQQQMKVKNIRMAAIRSLTGVFSILAIVLAQFNFGLERQTADTLRILLYCLTGISLLWFVFSTWTGAKRRVQKEEKIRRDFQRAYVCPCSKCGMFFGYDTPYEMLIRNGKCNKCNSHFTH